jgi:hypothetical protein
VLAETQHSLEMPNKNLLTWQFSICVWQELYEGIRDELNNAAQQKDVIMAGE